MCIFAIAYPDVWEKTLEHRLSENMELTRLDSNKLIHYIKNGYNPESFAVSLLSNPDLLKDYGKCMEVSGSMWAFLGSALDKVRTTPNNEEE